MESPLISPQVAINTMRTLAMDAVQKANSGHPGTPMALSPVVYCLWQEFLRFDPQHPIWPNRDRFVLSVGHASMLLYSILHLTGVKSVNEKYEATGEAAVSLDDIKKFRQLGSKCPGHPEYHMTTGVEATTGPLGQGVAMSVGMAISKMWLAQRYNRPGFDIFNYNVYALTCDGDMMEGISSEAASLAGHLKLSNLCWIYDSNGISIDGHTDITFTEDTAKRFEAYGWEVLHVNDANDLGQIRAAIEATQKTRDRPLFVLLKSHIGFGSPNKQDKASAHGEALGEEEVCLTKKAYGWPEDAKFLVPDGVYAHFQNGIGKRGAQLEGAWEELMARYRKQYPDLAAEINRIERRELPEGWDRDLPTFPTDAKGVATRESSAKVLNAVAKNIPWLIGGAADLAASTKTTIKADGAGDFEPGTYGGRNLHFGIREHSMGAALNGMALSKLRSYGSTFLIFSDYEKPAIRLSALMEVPVIHIFTHDSIGLGEDGPTHQPIEQLSTLRAIPGLVTLRPADANEVVECWRVLMPLKHQPVALVLSRQALPTLDRTKYAPATGVKHGAYVLWDTSAGGKSPDVLLLGTGSEVSLCLQAAEALLKENIHARVVSMPSWDLFEKQSDAYKESVLPSAIDARVSVEQASTMGWAHYVGRDGETIGMTSFGASAPIKDLLEHFGFTLRHVVEAAKRQVQRKKRS